MLPSVTWSDEHIVWVFGVHTEDSSTRNCCNKWLLPHCLSIVQHFISFNEYRKKFHRTLSSSYGQKIQFARLKMEKCEINYKKEE